MKIDIGCGTQRYEGYTPHDWSLDHDARYLPYEDNSLEEVRASHVLEHLPKGDVEETLRHWVSKIKPGGILRIAVPDFDEIVRLAALDRDSEDESKPPFPWESYIMGGQTTPYDSHRTLWNYPKLKHAMEQQGLIDITEWKNDYSGTNSTKRECSDHVFSLNLAGRKPGVAAHDAPPPKYPDMRAVMTMPRLAWTDNMFCVSQACMKIGIEVQNSIGVFYGQGIQRVLESCVAAENLKWALTIDYDSIFDWKDIVCLRQIAEDAGLDAIAPMQAGRERNVALFNTVAEDGSVQPARAEDFAKPWFPVSTMHFGLTLIRLDTLRKMPKPWFKSDPAHDGTWNDGRMDDDIYFWRKAKENGWKIGVSPKVHIGHIECMISWVTPDKGKEYQSMFSWLRGGKPWYVRNREQVWRMPTSLRPPEAQG